MSGRIFHLVRGRDWAAFLRSGAAAWRPLSLSREGFCHLSFAEQLAGTLEAHFTPPDPRAGAPFASPSGPVALVLLEIDRTSAADALQLEPSREGMLFPHLYRAIRRDEILGAWRLERRSAGWPLPRLGAEREADQPPGEPLPPS